MKILRSFLFLSFFTLFINSSGLAQQTGSLTGQVSDSLGSVVTGATVIVIDAAGAKEKSVVTNRQGEFTINGLAPGKYTIRVTAPKFGLYENSNIEIKTGEQQKLTIALSIESIKELVQVGNDGQISTDNDNNASAIVLKGKDLDYLPEDPDELNEALQALAPSAGPEGATFYIDGFTGGRLPPKAAIREIRINNNPFSAEYERLGFGRIEILTKPGSAKWSGQGFFNFNDARFNTRNPFAFNRAPGQMKFFGGNISGPIQKGKSSFFLDASNRQVDDNRIVSATILDSILNIVPFRQDIVVPAHRFSFSPRFDYQINERNTLSVRYSLTAGKADRQGVADFSLPTRAFQTSNTDHELRLTETSVLNSKTVNETRFQYAAGRSRQTGDNSIPTINVSGAFTGGGGQVGLNFTNSNRWELQNNTTTSLGGNNRHSIKFGGRLRGVTINDRSESNFRGTFTFAGVRDPVTGALLFSSIEQYRQKVSGNPNPLFNPNQFSITAGNPLAGISQFDVGLFASDDWKISPDLTLSFGLRYENQNNISDNTNFAPRFSFAYAPGAGNGKQAKTVFRGGFGVFYDRFNENLSLQTERFDGTNQVQYVLTSNQAILGQSVFSLNGVTNIPTAAQIGLVAPGTITIRRAAEDLQSPTTLQTAFSIERQLPGRTTAAITYIANHNFNMLRSRNINAPVCPPLQLCAAAAQRPDPSQGNIYQYESSGVLNQQQMVININSRFSPKFSFSANYRLGFAKGNTDGAGTFPAYSYDPGNEYGNSSSDVRHIFFVRASITLPWHIQISPSVFGTSGRPFNITTGADTNRDSIFSDRPTFTELSRACMRQGLTESFCDIGGIAAPETTIIPRNYGRGPKYLTVNLGLNKTFGFGLSPNSDARQNGQKNEPGKGSGGGGGSTTGMIHGEGGGAMMMGGGGGTDKPYNLTFGLQILNLFNRNNAGLPIGNISSDRFGRSSSTLSGFGPFSSSGTASRRVEAQLRFSF